MDVNTIQELANSWGVLLIPLVTALVSIIKNLIPESRRDDVIPGLTVLIGILLGMFVIGFNRTAVIAGAIIGLSSNGLFSLAIKPIKNRMSEKDV